MASGRLGKVGWTNTGVSSPINVYTVPTGMVATVNVRATMVSNTVGGMVNVAITTSGTTVAAGDYILQAQTLPPYTAYNTTPTNGVLSADVTGIVMTAGESVVLVSAGGGNGTVGSVRVHGFEEPA